MALCIGSINPVFMKPLFKCGAMSEFTNYRPIAILSAVSKVLEKCVCAQISLHMERNNLFFKNQFGFRPGHSTIHAILKFCDTVQAAIAKNDFNITVFIDLKKAFDTVDFEVLLAKLRHYGFSGVVNDWFRSYLTGRLQITEINGVRSDTRTVRTGVPQGSVCGPLLFLILINDFHLAVDTETVLFADDTTLQVSGPSMPSLTNQMNLNLSNAADWFRANLLTLNTSKTKFILFSPKNRHVHNPILTIDGCNIEQIGSNLPTKTFKFLGLNIDDNLNWKEHVNYVKRKLYSGCFGLSSCKHFLPFKAKSLIFNSLVMSHLTYGIMAVGCASPGVLVSLVRMQKKAIRHVHNAGYNAHTAPLFLASRVLNYSDCVDFYRAVFVHGYINDLTPETFRGKFQFIHQVGNDRNRSDDGKLFVPIHNRNVMKSPTWEAIKLWNTLPPWLRKISKQSQFKTELKNYFLSKYELECTLETCKLCGRFPV